MTAVGAMTACSTNGAQTEAPQQGAAQSGGDAKEKVELRVAWWGGQDRHDRTLKAIELYESKNPHITITPEYSGFDGYFDKMTTQFAAASAPDVIQFGGNLNDFVSKGVVLELNPFVGKELDLSKHDKSMVDSATIDGKIYGVTLGSNAYGILLNKTLFDQAGIALPSKEWTYAEFADIAAKLSQSLKGTYGTEDFQQSAFSIYLEQRGKSEYSDGKVGFDVQDAQTWFQMWADMRKQGGVVPPEIQAAASSTPEQTMIVQRNVAMQLVPSNQYGAFRNATKDELVMHIFPYDLGQNGIALRPSQFMAGYKGTKHPEEVAKFLDFIVNDPEATAILGNDRGAPVNSEVRQNLIGTANEVDKAIFSYIDWVGSTSQAPYRPNMPGYNEHQALYLKQQEKVAFGQATVEAAAKEYYTELEKIIARATK